MEVSIGKKNLNLTHVQHHHFRHTTLLFLRRWQAAILFSKRNRQFQVAFSDMCYGKMLYLKYVHLFTSKIALKQILVASIFFQKGLRQFQVTYELIAHA